MSEENIIPTEATEYSGELVAMIEVDRIKPNPLQPRTKVKPEDIADLTVSIKDNGILQPLLVSPQDDY